MMIVDVKTLFPGIHLHTDVLHMGTGVYELLSLPKLSETSI